MDANSMHTTGSTHSSPPTETPPPLKHPETSTPQHPQQSSAGVIVLQWLTYAFWGWLIAGLLWLMSVILINAILKESVSGAVPYAIAASIVLLPIAFFCDFFYRKHEQTKKVGAAVVIMVIHAVLFALLGIGGLIIAVFTGINALINIGEPINNQMVVLLVAAFAALLYAGAFIRTLNPFKSKKPLLAYGVTMASLAFILLIFAVVGPVVTSVASRGDRLIEQGLSSVQASINDYIVENNQLPSSLRDVTLSSTDAEDLVTNNSVIYKADGEKTRTSAKNMNRTSVEYNYQLCVEYKTAQNSGSNRATNTSNDYSSYLTTYSHGTGNTCYKLQQIVYPTTN